MDSLFFFLSKLIWYSIKPGNLMVIALVAIVIIWYRGHALWAKRCLSMLVVVLLIILLLPIGPLLLYPLESRFGTHPPLPDHVDGVIVLGGAIDPVASRQWQQVETGGSAERLHALLTLSRQFPEATLVYTGGSGSLTRQGSKEADIAKLFYSELGFKEGQIVFERDSRNTFENGVNSKKIVNPNPGDIWILVTSAYHMPRSVGVFCQLGWSVIPYPVDHLTFPESLYNMSLDFGRNLVYIDTGLKEWVGLVAYYLTGKTTAIYPLGC